MSANKQYTPCYVGGKIKGISITIKNPTSGDIEFKPSQGVYYVYQGSEFPLIAGSNVTIGAGKTYQSSRELDPPFIPDSDIKLMVSTGDLTGCTIDVSILWEVD